jgi:two-component system OmpR family response regulator
MFSDLQSAAEPSVSSLRILIVDDDAAASEALSRILTRRGHVVRELNEATGVVAAALEFRPQVVILDFLMPDCDGGRPSPGNSRRIRNCAR